MGGSESNSCLQWSAVLRYLDTPSGVLRLLRLDAAVANSGRSMLLSALFLLDRSYWKYREPAFLAVSDFLCPCCYGCWLDRASYVHHHFLPLLDGVDFLFLVGCATNLRRKMNK